MSNSQTTNIKHKSFANNIKIVNRRVDELSPYANNPRDNDDAVPAVARSIEMFGFKVPIVVDPAGVIVCGHTRLKAAISLGLETVPCVVADDLSEEQIKAFRLADNRTSEIAYWDFSRLDEELEALGDFDLGFLGFDEPASALTELDELFDALSGSVSDDADSESPDAPRSGPDPEQDNAEDLGARRLYICPECGEKFEL